MIINKEAYFLKKRLSLLNAICFFSFLFLICFAGFIFTKPINPNTLLKVEFSMLLVIPFYMIVLLVYRDYLVQSWQIISEINGDLAIITDLKDNIQQITTTSVTIDPITQRAEIVNWLDDFWQYTEELTDKCKVTLVPQDICTKINLNQVRRYLSSQKTSFSLKKTDYAQSFKENWQAIIKKSLKETILDCKLNQNNIRMLDIALRNTWQKKANVKLKPMGIEITMEDIMVT